jgi:hypothetical protein
MSLPLTKLPPCLFPVPGVGRGVPRWVASLSDGAAISAAIGTTNLHEQRAFLVLFLGSNSTKHIAEIGTRIHGDGPVFRDVISLKIKFWAADTLRLAEAGGK